MTAAEDQYSFDGSPIAPGVRVGSYLIEEIIGTGGMGSVFRARHIGLDKLVALKSLHGVFAVREASVQRFVREGRAASKIRHPHVVDVTDVGTFEGIPYLVMEYLEGEDLDVRLDERGALPPDEIVAIMLPVMDALATAHEAGVVHRDLKPSNIFLSRGSRNEVIPIVLDFGIAKILDSGGVERLSITRAGAFVGTPFYASPEQARNGRDATAASDQYSLAAIIYQLASGRLPVEGATPFEVLGRIVSGDITAFSTLRTDWNPILEHAVERAMSGDPAHRFPSVREFAAQLLPLGDAATRARWQAVFGEPAPLHSAGASAFAQTMAPGALEAARLSGADLVATQPRIGAPAVSKPVVAPAETHQPAPASAEGIGVTRSGEHSVPDVALETAPGGGWGLPVGSSHAHTGPVPPGPLQAHLGQGPAAQPSFTPPARVADSGQVSLAPSMPPREVSHPPPRPKSRGMGWAAALAVVGLAVLLVLGAVGYVVLGGPATPEESPPRVEPTVAPSPPIHLSVSPASATIALDGEPIGTGSADVVLDGAEHQVVVSAPGHETIELSLAADAAGFPSSVVLVAAAEPEPGESGSTEAPEGADAEAAAEGAEPAVRAPEPSIARPRAGRSPTSRPSFPPSNRRLGRTGRFGGSRSTGTSSTGTSSTGTSSSYPPRSTGPRLGTNRAPVLH